MKIIERRYMSMEDLRELCIKYKWFTHADNEEYGKFLRMTKDRRGFSKVITTTQLYKMAKMVERYSELSGILDTAAIMYTLCEICQTTFDIEGE